MRTTITIVGAGIAGMCLASYLAKHGIDIVLIDQKNLKPKTTQDDGRSYAIAYGSSLILKEAGIWKNIQDSTCPILNIHVSDNKSSAYVHYDHEMVSKLPMGYMISATILENALIEEIKKQPNIRIIDQANIENITLLNEQAIVTLENKQTISSQLLIAADGKNSLIRKLAQIETIEHDYKYTAIVCNIEHEKNHDNLAQEVFLSSGPFASLPLKGGHQSSLVWTEKSPLAKLYLAMSDSQCAQHIESRIGLYLGKITNVTKRHNYPLKLTLAKTYSSKRLALISDAAHAIHPLAGQGLNLGIRDIEVLGKIIINQHKLGLDLGSDILLQEYNSLRLFDSWSMIGVTHLLHYLFSINNVAIKISRRLGMNIVNNSPFLKRSLIRHAMGI